MRTKNTISLICVLSKRISGSVTGKYRINLIACITAFILITQISTVSAQAVLFDFDSAPLFTSLPIYQTVGAITAHLTATGSGYSIQNANVLGFTPAGFSGRIIYPNSINLADLIVKFDHTLTDFSVMYCCQELACDDAATMKVTAFRNGVLIGFNTRTATFPGTWPVDTLRCTFASGFDSVVVHYNSHPPTCQDYGVIFLVDNMRVTPYVTGITGNETPVYFKLNQNYPNPFNPSTTINYQIPKQSLVTLKVYDALGKEVEILVNSVEQPGQKSVNFNSGNLSSGVYYYTIRAGDFAEIKKMVVLK